MLIEIKWREDQLTRNNLLDNDSEVVAQGRRKVEQVCIKLLRNQKLARISNDKFAKILVKRSVRAHH